MRRFVLMISALAVLPLAGCQSTSTSDGIAYKPPCGYRAVDAGFCPYAGYRAPVDI